MSGKKVVVEEVDEVPMTPDQAMRGLLLGIMGGIALEPRERGTLMEMLDICCPPQVPVMVAEEE